jgi:hypothetical protein
MRGRRTLLHVKTVSTSLRLRHGPRHLGHRCLGQKQHELHLEQAHGCRFQDLGRCPTGISKSPSPDAVRFAARKEPYRFAIPEFCTMGSCTPWGRRTNVPTRHGGCRTSVPARHGGRQSLRHEFRLDRTDRLLRRVRIDRLGLRRCYGGRRSRRGTSLKSGVRWTTSQRRRGRGMNSCYVLRWQYLAAALAGGALLISEAVEAQEGPSRSGWVPPASSHSEFFSPFSSGFRWPSTIRMAPTAPATRTAPITVPTPKSVRTVPIAPPALHTPIVQVAPLLPAPPSVWSEPLARRVPVRPVEFRNWPRLPKQPHLHLRECTEDKRMPSLATCNPPIMNDILAPHLRPAVGLD